MYFAIFSLAFLVVAGLAFLFGALKAKRLRWQASLSRIIITVVSALLSVGVSLLICWVLIEMIVNKLIAAGKLGDISSLLIEAPSLEVAALAFGSMIVAPILFLLFFAIIRPIASIFIPSLAKLMLKKEDKEELHYKPNGKVDKSGCLKLPKAKAVSVLLGGFSGILLLCILIVPVVGFTGVAADIGRGAISTLTHNDPKVAEAVDALDTNVGTVTVKAMGGGLLFDLMTSYPMENGMATLRHEGEFIGAAATAIASFSDETVAKQDRIDNLHKADEKFNDSTLLPVVVSELVSAASDSWSRDEAYHGIALPAIGGEDFKPVVKTLINGLSGSTTETIKVDIATVIDIFCSIIDNDIMDKLSGDPLAILSNEKCTSEILLALLDNPRMCVTVDGISDFGLSLLMEGVEANENTDGLYDEMMNELSAVDGADEKELKKAYSNVFDKYGIRAEESDIDALVQNKLSPARTSQSAIISSIVASEDDFNKKTVLVSTDMITDGTATVQDHQKEAVALAHAYAVMYSMLDDLEGDYDVKAVLNKLGPALDSFAATETVGKDKTAHLLTAILQSEKVRDSMGLTLLSATDTSISISESAETKKYDSTLVSLSKLIDVVEASSDAEKDSEEAVKALLDDLSPESAKVIQTISTPEVMMNYGVSEKSAEPTSSMVSNTFGNLADAKANGMPDEEYEKESAAVNDMMNVFMSSDKSNGSTFGEGSATGKSAQELVDNVMNSSVMSQTVVEEVYGDGDTAKSDPLNSERQLSEDEKAEFLAAVNNSWAENSDDPDAEKKLTAIGSVMNINVKLEGNTWVIA